MNDDIDFPDAIAAACETAGAHVVHDHTNLFGERETTYTHAAGGTVLVRWPAETLP